MVLVKLFGLFCERLESFSFVVTLKLFIIKKKVLNTF